MGTAQVGKSDAKSPERQKRSQVAKLRIAFETSDGQRPRFVYQLEALSITLCSGCQESFSRGQTAKCLS